MFIKHMKNKLFFAKFLATSELFVYEQKVIAPVLGDEFRLLDQVQSGGIYHGQEAEEDQGHLSYLPRSAASHTGGVIDSAASAQAVAHEKKGSASGRPFCFVTARCLAR
jgi:hypothetical protein